MSVLHLKPSQTGPNRLHSCLRDAMEDAASRLADENKVEAAWELRGMIERLSGRPLTRDACDEAGDYESDFIDGWVMSEEFCACCGERCYFALEGRKIECVECAEPPVEEHHPDGTEDDYRDYPDTHQVGPDYWQGEDGEWRCG